MSKPHECNINESAGVDKKIKVDIIKTVSTDLANSISIMIAELADSVNADGLNNRKVISGSSTIATCHKEGYCKILTFNPTIHANDAISCNNDYDDVAIVSPNSVTIYTHGGYTEGYGEVSGVCRTTHHDVDDSGIMTPVGCYNTNVSRIHDNVTVMTVDNNYNIHNYFDGVADATDYLTQARKLFVRGNDAIAIGANAIWTAARVNNTLYLAIHDCEFKLMVYSDDVDLKDIECKVTDDIDLHLIMTK